MTDPILAALSDGQWHRMNDLAHELGRSRRDIEEAVEDHRVAGEPIIAGSFGLRLAQTAQELEEYTEARRRRLVTVYKGTRALRQAARRLREAEDAQADLTLGLSA